MNISENMPSEARIAIKVIRKDGSVEDIGEVLGKSINKEDEAGITLRGNESASSNNK